MKKSIYCLALTMIFPVSGAFSEIIPGSDQVNYNQNLSFSPHSITPRLPGAGFAPAGLVYTCTTSTAKIDLFIMEELLGTCTWICHTLAIGSPRPFYLSKKPLESISLSSPLRIRDTMLFTLYDTVHKDIHVRDSTNCYLPHIAPTGTSGTAIAPDRFIIFKNSDNKYVLAKFEEIWDIDIDYEPMPTSHSYLKGYSIHWYLQTDGTLNFGDITHVRMQLPPKKAVVEIRPGTKEFLLGTYNIRGQRIAADYHAICQSTGVMLVKKGSGVVRVFNSDQIR